MLTSNLRNIIFFLHAVFSQAFLRQKFIPDERRFSKNANIDMQMSNYWVQNWILNNKKMSLK